jgi:ABC-type antimicrobial peptide transport system permease subunit
LNLNRGYINGIIKTDYSTKYKPLFEKFQNKSFNINDILEDELFQQFSADVYSKLGFSYAISENYVEDFIQEDVYQTIWTHGLKLDDKVYYCYSGPQVWKGKTKGYSIDDNSVWMNYQKYNEVFGTEYTASNLKTFVPHTIKLEQYYYNDFEQKNPLMSIEITIEKLSNSGPYIFIAGDNIYSKFKNNSIYTKGLYFDGNENLNVVLEVADELNFEQRLFIVEGIHTMTKAVDVFIPIFELVAIVLCAGIIFILISFSTKMVKDKMHDIGILKALGCKNSTIGIIFGLQLLLIALCTIILSTIGYFFFIDLANDVLIESLKILAPSHIVLDLDFLTFKINVVGVNSLLVVILTIVSFIIPMLKIYNIKPVQIIKTKE